MVVNIVIGILSVIDGVLLYIIDVKIETVMGEVLFDVAATVMFVIAWHYILEDNEKAIVVYKWVVLIWSIVALIGLVWALVKNNLTGVQTNFSIVIPLSLAYFIMQIKQKIEG